MFIKKYEAESLDQALSLIKGELGPEALILSTQEKKRKWFQKRLIEVTAAKNEKSEPKVNPTFDEEYLKKIFPHRCENVEKNTGDRLGGKLNKYLDTYEPVIKSVPQNHDVSTHTQYMRQLKNCGLSEDSAKELTTRLIFDYSQEKRSQPKELEALKIKLIASQVQTLSPIIFESRPNWSVIGIAGVGKTSLLVKLALFLRRYSYNVQFVSCDKRKLTGRRELFSYGRIMNVDCFENPIEIKAGTIQLIDTPAYSVRGFTDTSKDIDEIVLRSNVILVLDASTRLDEALNIVDSTMKFKPSGIAFTRLDVATKYGVIYDVLKKTKLPLFGVSLASSFKVPFRFLTPEEVGCLIIKGAVE